MPKVVYEPKIAAHDPLLYRTDSQSYYVEGGFPAIDERHIDKYNEDGYLIIRNGLTTDEVNKAKQQLVEMTLSDAPNCTSIYYEGAIRDLIGNLINTGDAADKTGVKLALGEIGEELPKLPNHVRASYVRKFMGFVSHYPALYATAYKKEMLDLIDRLLQSPGCLFQEMAMIKPPNGREKPWHQDHAYFNLPLDTKIIGVWIALGDVTTENGCMHVIKGGHLGGPKAHFMVRDWQICDTDMWQQSVTAISMKAGDIMIFDGKLPHGTPTNVTNEQRWALQFHYIPQQVNETPDSVRLAAFGNEGKDVSC
jgi:phytanoyl-CoA hydroxylase